MTDYVISYDLKAANPSPYKVFLDAAQREGLLYVWKGLNYVNRLPNTTIWGVFSTREEANEAFDRALAAASAKMGYKVSLLRRATTAFSDCVVNSDIRKKPEPQWTGPTLFETSRLHQLNDPFFTLR